MKRILVPLDGSKLADAAMPLANGLAKDSRAEVVFVAVGALPETSLQAAEERADFTELLARMVSEFALPARNLVETAGDPAEGILRVAEDEDVELIVVSTHGRSGLSELAQGSVSRVVLRQGWKPVLLTRPEQLEIR